jgi:hypothetical protein
MKDAIGDGLRLLTAVMLGASFGTILTGTGLLVPYWQALPPADFLAWFGANAEHMLRFFGPVQAVSVVIAIVSAAAATWAGHPSKSLAIVAAALAVAMLGLYPIYFQQANAAFETATISVADVSAALAQWATWQWVRTGISAAAFVASLLVLRRAA